MTETASRVPTRTALAYGTGQLGAQVFRDTPAVLLPIFMSTMLGIPPWLAGIVILIPKLWVILCDPMVGVWSDKLKGKHGRTGFLAVGALLTSLGFVSLFLFTDYGSPTIGAIAICALFFLASTGFSLYSVPYLALASELSDDKHERTRILTYRMMATIGGVVIGVGVAQPLVFAFGGGELGWRVMAVSLAILCFVSMIVPAIFLKGVPLLKSEAASGMLWDQLRPVFQNKPYVILLATTFMQNVGQASGYTVIGFYYFYALNQVELIPTFVMIMAMGSVLSQPLFLWLSRRFGKERSFVLGSVLWIFVTITWYFVEPESPVVLSIPLLGDLTREGLYVLMRGFFIGIVNPGFLLLAYSMLTDTVEHQRRTTGVANEGIFSGIFTAAEKLAFALGPLVAGIVMSSFGFVSSTSGAVAQSESAIHGIILLYSAVPVIAQVISMVIFSRYKLEASAEA